MFKSKQPKKITLEEQLAAELHISAKQIISVTQEPPTSCDGGTYTFTKKYGVWVCYEPK